MSSSYQAAKDSLALTANIVRSRGLGEWEEFIQALKNYEIETQKMLVQSPVDKLQVFQGRAQECAQIVEHLEQCHSLADSITQRKRHGTPSK